MPIHDAWTYDQAPQSTTDISAGSTLPSYSSNGTYNQYSGLPGMLYKNTGGTGNIGTDGFVQLVSSSAWNPALLVKASDVQDWSSATTKYWIGFRTKFTTQNLGTCALFRMSDSLSQGNITTFLLESDMTAAGANVANTEYYVEVFIDRVNLVYQVWINGTNVKNGSILAASVVAGGGGFFFWGAMNSPGATAGATRLMRDFYFVDVDAVLTPGRLGAIRSQPQTNASVTAPNYTAPTGLVSLVGSAALSTTQVKFGASSFVLGATAGSCATMPDASNLRLTGDFTIEFFHYNPSISTSVMYVNKGTNAYIFNNAGSISVSLDPSNVLVINTPSKLVANTWQHIALTKQGSTISLWVNGAAAGSATSTGTFGNVASALQIGTWNNNTDLLNGFMDEFRISNIARYSAPFTPPAAAFTPDANTVSLLHFDSLSGSSLIDSGVTSLAVVSAPLLSPPIMTPNIANAPSNDPLTLGLSLAPASVGRKILAVDFRMASQCTQTAQVAGKLTDGTNTLNLPTYSFPDTTAQYGRRIALSSVAADGAAWTAAKVASNQLVLTPNG
ncbi:MAG: LamG domain-containing protein [Sulfuriferula sp.]|nr:LamG domain-containing protein [Sulfuriferula sp.]